MLSRVEEKYYNDIGKIARAMERVAAALEFEAGMRNNSGADAEPELVAAGIGRRIKERLNELGMTKHELAIACGIDDKKIKLYTIGYTTPKAQTCEKIAEALECSVEWLLGTGGKENESVL